MLVRVAGLLPQLCGRLPVAGDARGVAVGAAGKSWAGGRAGAGSASAHRAGRASRPGRSAREAAPGTAPRRRARRSARRARRRPCPTGTVHSSTSARRAWSRPSSSRTRRRHGPDEPGSGPGTAPTRARSCRGCRARRSARRSRWPPRPTARASRAAGGAERCTCRCRPGSPGPARSPRPPRGTARPGRDRRAATDPRRGCSSRAGRTPGCRGCGRARCSPAARPRRRGRRAAAVRTRGSCDTAPRAGAARASRPGRSPVQVGQSRLLLVEQHEQPTDVEQGVGTLLALEVVLGELEGTYGGDPGGAVRSVSHC